MPKKLRIAKDSTIVEKENSRVIISSRKNNAESLPSILRELDEIKKQLETATKPPIGEKEAKKFMREILQDQSWAIKASTLRKLAIGLLEQQGKSNPTNKELKEAEKLIAAAIDNLQYNLELKVLAGLDWKKNDNLEFLFQR